MVRREHGEWVALAGIPLSAKAGAKLQVEVIYGSGKCEVRLIAVLPKKYPTQHLTVPADQADLPLELLSRYAQEREHLPRVLRIFTEPGPDDLGIVQPVAGRRSGTFGLRRVINKVAPALTAGWISQRPPARPSRRRARGRSSNVREFLFLGRTIVLDHGQGLLTLYAHLSTVRAATGDSVAAGATIATSARPAAPPVRTFASRFTLMPS